MLACRVVLVEFGLVAYVKARVQVLVLSEHAWMHDLAPRSVIRMTRNSLVFWPVVLHAIKPSVLVS